MTPEGRQRVDARDKRRVRTTVPALTFAVGRAAVAAALSTVVIAGCGRSGTARPHKPVSPAPGKGIVAYSALRAAVVTMRQYSPESLMWQTVSIDGNGTGVLTSLIAEISGAVRRSFHLPAPQAARLRRLLGAARRAPSPRGRDPRAELYTLHISGEPTAAIQGSMPKPLRALVSYLSGLMLTYCC
jgi:hypothetical protein